MRRHCLVTPGNRCTTAEAPVPPHKARIFGMSDEQVLCIIHLCSIFHVQEQEGGFGVYWGVGWVEGLFARLLAQWGASPQEVSQ